MIATDFDESNAVLSKPVDMDHNDCTCLSVLKTETETGVPVVVSCWKFTKEEMKIIEKTGRLWLTVVGRTMSPVMLTGEKPF